VTADKTPATLATAKHGGCVQLATSERERFEAWHCEKFKTSWQTGAPTRDMHNGVYAENYGPAEQQARWELWQAAWKSALSAQPSPGGQDVLATVEELAELNRACAALDPDYKGPTDAAVQVLIAALAARQPVGEPVAWMTHHDEPMLYPTFAEAAAYCEDDEPPIPLYAAQLAQPVDLGPVRSALQAAAALCDCCASVDGYSRSELNAFGQNMRSQFTDALALIDSQALGNG